MEILEGLLKERPSDFLLRFTYWAVRNIYVIFILIWVFLQRGNTRFLLETDAQHHHYKAHRADPTNVYRLLALDARF